MKWKSVVSTRASSPAKPVQVIRKVFSPRFNDSLAPKKVISVIMKRRSVSFTGTQDSSPVKPVQVIRKKFSPRIDANERGKKNATRKITPKIVVTNTSFQ